MQMEPNPDSSISSQTFDKPSENENGLKEDQNVNVTTTDILRQDSSAGSSTETSKPDSHIWKTSFFRLAPLAGIFCMAVAVASIIAALGILIGSRGAAVPTWTIPPSTYLAICTAVANQALRFAAFQGLAIAWWFRATRGSTLRQLHRSWRSGMTAGGAITSGRNMGLIGLACLASTFVAVDGPLLQKGTTIEYAPIVAASFPLNVTMAQEIPRDVSGGWWNDTLLYRLSTSFNETIPTVTGHTSNLIQLGINLRGAAAAQWYQTQPIPGIIHGCPAGSICKANIRAPAFAVTSCIFQVIPVNYWAPLRTLKNIIKYTKTSPPISTMAFLVDVSLSLDGKERLNLITGYGRNENCTGTFNYTICTLEAAVGEYEVLVKDDKVTKVNPFPHIIALANNTRTDNDWNAREQWYPSTLAGICQLAISKWDSVVNYYYTSGTVLPTGWFPHISTLYMDDTGDDFENELCKSFNDPHEDVIGDLNTLMFLSGAEVKIGSGTDRSTEYIDSHTDPDLPIRTTIEGYFHGKHNVFRTNLHWFVAAAVIELICIILIAPTYYGWWKLGRSVSFSPLETAKAFEAPLLGECNSNSTGGDIAKAVGDVRIRYGQTSGGAMDQNGAGNQTKLAFANPAIVHFPRNDTRLDY